MKNLNLSIISAIILLLLIGSVSIAQPYRGMKSDQLRMGFVERLDLTETQKEAIENLRYDHRMKAAEYHKNLEQNKLTINKLFGEASPDRSEIMNLVEENNSLKGELQKMRMEMRLEVNSLLTEEQKDDLSEMQNLRKGRGFGKGDGKRFHQNGRHYRGDCRW